MSPARGFSSRPGFLFWPIVRRSRRATCPRPQRKSTARKPAWCNPARCARRSARPRRRCSSPKAMSTTAPPRPRRALRARTRAINIRALPIRPSTCSSGAWRRSKAPKPRAPPRPAWPRSRCRWSARSRPAITSSPRRRCSAPAATSSRIICRALASPRRWSTAAISRPGATRCGRTPRPSSSKARPIRRST